MRFFLCLAALLSFGPLLHAQELYPFSDPAPNVPANALVAKGTVLLGKRRPLSQRYMPELMAGLGKKLMLRAGVTWSNMVRKDVRWESAYLYGKYRFFSKDGVHTHFRIAGFTEVGYSKNPLINDEINLQGDISGVQGGLVATQLVHKLALSASASYLRALKTKSEHDHSGKTTQALGYSLSAGHLILPRVYKSYDQLNLNLYAELLGQKALDRQAWFVDGAPALQLIFRSNTKLNLGYRFQLGGNAMRFNREMFMVAVEHTFFNALKP